jgi:hypothetical protein
MTEGTGLVLTEFTVEESVLPRFRHWHTAEHIGERLAVGLKSARRYASASEPPVFFCLYRGETSSLFETTAYRGLFDKQSDLTRQVTAGIKGTRFVGDIVHEEGSGHGGWLWRVRFSSDPGDDEAFGAWFEDIAPTLRDDPGVVRMTLARPKRDATGITDASWLLLLEGDDEAALSRIGGKVEKAAPPEADEVDGRLFRLEYLSA